MRALHLVRVTPFPLRKSKPSFSRSDRGSEEAREAITTPQGEEKGENSIPPSQDFRAWCLFWLLTTLVLMGSGTVGAFLLLRMPSSNCQHLSLITSAGESIHCARQKVESGETKQLLIALDLVAKVPQDHALYPEAERLMGEWSQKALELAQEAIHDGDLQGGILIADRVPVLSSLYPNAQAAIATWQEEWQRGEEIVQQFQKALGVKDGESATKLYLSLSEFESEYWRTVRADELMFELSAQKSAWQRLNEIQPLMTSELPEVVERAIILAVELNHTDVAKALAKAEKGQWEQILLKFVASLWQEKRFQDAIQVAQVISPNQASYSQAQDWMLLSRLSHAAEKESAIADALAAVRQINPSSPVYPFAQKQALEWETQVQKQAQRQAEDPVARSQPNLFQEQAARSLLKKAQELAQNGDLATAIETAQKISRNHALYQEAQQTIESWKIQLQTLRDRETLQIASTLAVQGKIQEAIQTAEKIQPNHPLYQQAKIAIATWRSQLRTPQEL